MRFNALPFLFLPGVALIGYLVGGGSGIIWAVALWGGIVLLGTLLNLRRYLADRAQRDDQRDDDRSAADSRPAVFQNTG